MNCQSIQNKLPVYFSDGLDSGMRQAVESHLEGCSDCRTYLTGIYRVDTAFKESVKRKMASQAPPGDAWEKIAARLPSQNSRPMQSLRFRQIALAAAIVLLFSLLFIPPVYARLEKIFSGWLVIQVPHSGTTVTIDNFQAFTPYIPTYLPTGFDLTTTGTHTSPDGQELELTYARGKDIFLLVEKNQANPTVASDGTTVDLSGAKGILLDPANSIEEQYRATFPAGTIRVITWYQEGILINLYSNMPVEDMVWFARSMQPVQK